MTDSGTLALVESPVQLLNVLEWAHVHPPAVLSPRPGTAPSVPGPVAPGRPLTIVALAPRDPMTRGQLRRMAELAMDEGITVRWCEARASRGSLLRTAAELAPGLRAAGRIVLGDPFSRLVQVLLPLSRAKEITVVDDGTATMEFTELLAKRARLVRWHRSGRRLSPVDAAFGGFASAARRRLTPGPGRRVELFSSMPASPPAGMAVRANRFAWTRARFGPPAISAGTDIVGTSLVETGVVDPERYLAAVASLTRAHGATRYFAHRRESADKLRRLTAETGLQIVRPDLPLELIARRGPIGHTILSFPSTVVHTLPLALEGTGVTIRVCDVDPEWLTDRASPRAQSFLAAITGSARDLHGLAEVASAAPTVDGDRPPG
jgi:hypothetical protein